MNISKICFGKCVQEEVSIRFASLFYSGGHTAQWRGMDLPKHGNISKKLHYDALHVLY